MAPSGTGRGVGEGSGGVPDSPPDPFIRIAAEAVRQPGAVELLRELAAIRREMAAEKARERFNTALAKLRAEAPVIVKEKPVPTKDGRVAYKFAPIEAIEIQIRPLLEKYGFAHRFDTAVDTEKGWVEARIHISLGAHTETTSVRLPVGRGTLLMSESQVYAAAITFACRRALVAGYGLILAGDDVDGNTGQVLDKEKTAVGQPRRQALLKELWRIAPHPEGKRDWSEVNAWLAALGRKPVSSLSDEELEDVIRSLKSDDGNQVQ